MISIQSISQKVVPIAKQYGIRKIAVFGSLAKNTAHEDSDVDLLIDKGSLKGLWQYAGLVADLEDALGVHVDVLTYDSLHDAFLSETPIEEVVIYEE
ncbi:MAG: nucleotidyltransferase domain-containing protein [Clostridiales bacterium]|nr:nucleotidyltransferase domain-containing protein [Clostridiales bacterium]